jgi:hypothetical protein
VIKSTTMRVAARPAWRCRRAAWLVAALGLSPVLGCTAFQSVSSEQWRTTNFLHTGSEPKVSNVLAMWSGLRVTQDTVNGGRPLPGIVGRLYLMGEDSAVDASGTVTVLMHDVSDPGVEPRPLASWQFNRNSLKLLKRKDFIGEGYSLFLPWEEFNPGVSKVQMQICYKADQGAPYYASPSTIDLQQSDARPAIHERTIVPTGYSKMTPQ